MRTVRTPADVIFRFSLHEREIGQNPENGVRGVSAVSAPRASRSDGGAPTPPGTHPRRWRESRVGAAAATSRSMARSPSTPAAGTPPRAASAVYPRAVDRGAAAQRAPWHAPPSRSAHLTRCVGARRPGDILSPWTGPIYVIPATCGGSLYRADPGGGARRVEPPDPAPDQPAREPNRGGRPCT
jgi:hypothetical protein